MTNINCKLQYLLLEVGKLLSKVVENVLSSEEFGKEIAEGGAQSGQSTAENHARPKTEHGTGNHVQVTKAYVNDVFDSTAL